MIAKIRVLYADTDQMGVVNNVHYLRYFEVGRAEWIRARGRPYKEIEADGYRLPVVEAHLRYKESARYDDVLDIETRAEEVRIASMVFQYTIKRAADGVLLCEGYTKHACVNVAGKLVRFPDDLAALLQPEKPGDRT